MFRCLLGIFLCFGAMAHDKQSYFLFVEKSLSLGQADYNQLVIGQELPAYRDDYDIFEIQNEAPEVFDRVYRNPLTRVYAKYKLDKDLESEVDSLVDNSQQKQQLTKKAKRLRYQRLLAIHQFALEQIADYPNVESFKGPAEAQMFVSVDHALAQTRPHPKETISSYLSRAQAAFIENINYLKREHLKDAFELDIDCLDLLTSYGNKEETNNTFLSFALNFGTRSDAHPNGDIEFAKLMLAELMVENPSLIREF
ncbi:MAG: hypothetical protein AB7F43_12690 [Bacteriovoracia bacterium]